MNEKDTNIMDPNTLNLKNTPGQPSPTPLPTGTAVPVSTPTPSIAAGDSEEVVLNDAEKELRTRFELLPKEIQDTIISSDYQMKLFELAKKYKLTYAELGQLELDTTMVLLGTTRPEDFKNHLAESLKKDMATMDALVKEIDTQIFSSIRSALVALYEEKEEKREAVTTSPTSQPATPLAQELSSFVGNIKANAAPQTTTIPITTPQAAAAAPEIMPTLEKKEGDVMKDSGIDLGVSNGGAPVTDPFAAKMTGVFGIKSATTDHTIPKVGETKSAPLPDKPKKVDPYREEPV